MLKCTCLYRKKQTEQTNYVYLCQKAPYTMTSLFFNVPFAIALIAFLTAFVPMYSTIEKEDTPLQVVKSR